MREITLEAEVRKETGKHVHAVRRAGGVPGIFYVHGEENVPIKVPAKSLKPLIHTAEAHIVNLKLGPDSVRSCILRAIQFDPVTEQPVHFDLQGLRENEKITIEVPIVVTGGIPVGVRDGGVVQQVIHRLKISCLPKHIPDHVEVNAENLKINHFIHVRDLKIENVTVLENENSSIVGVVPPTIEKEPEPGVAAVEEAAEPEVIGKGKKPEEGAEGEAAAGEKGEKAEKGEKKAEAAPAGKAPAPGKEEKEKEKEKEKK